jgi:hypothetical protein
MRLKSSKLIAGRRSNNKLALKIDQLRKHKTMKICINRLKSLKIEEFMMSQISKIN